MGFFALLEDIAGRQDIVPYEDHIFLYGTMSIFILEPHTIQYSCSATRSTSATPFILYNCIGRDSAYPVVISIFKMQLLYIVCTLIGTGFFFPFSSSLFINVSTVDL